MRGTFSNVKKWRNTYCFIVGEDGRTYFCHRTCLVNKKDWEKYVWETNTCEFEPLETEEQRPRAMDVIPNHEENTAKIERNRQLQEEAKKRKEEKAKKAQANREANEKRHQRNLQKKEWDDSHTVYTIYYFDDGKTWKIIKPLVYFKDDKDAKKFTEDLKRLHPYDRYSIRKVYKIIIGGDIVLKEIPTKSNKNTKMYVKPVKKKEEKQK